MKLEQMDCLLRDLLDLDLSDQAKDQVTTLREGLMNSSETFEQFFARVLLIISQDLHATALHEATVMFQGVQIGHYVMFAEGEEQVREELKKICGDDVDIDVFPIEYGSGPYKIGEIS